MTAWDAGYAAGKEQRAAGVVMLDPFEVRQQAEAATTCVADADEWLYGFYKAALAEAVLDAA